MVETMAESPHPFRRRPQVETDAAVSLPDPKREDLSAAVPLGEPDDEGYLIEEEDREYPPSTDPKR